VLTTNRDLGNPDYVAAAQLFERAAEHGLADSQYNLGILYETGLGVPMDRVTAYKWYTRAATAGDAEAARRRDLLKAKLDPAALARAEKLSASWRPQFSDPVANEARAAGEAWKRREARAD